DALAMQTGSRLFDLQFRCAMEYRGSAPILAQMAYRRRDIHSGSYRRYTAPLTSVILGESAAGLRMSERVGGTIEREGGWIPPMDRAGAIVIDEHATVGLVTSLVLVRSGTPIARIEAPQARGQPPLEVEVPVP